MKPVPSSIVNSGNFGGVTKTMTIQRESMAHVMSVLTNLYADSTLAVIREYATNAIDAHRESGYTGPIVVTAPSGYRPTFTVEDFGVGMSTDTVLDLYSSYGASTKRETNEQTGMLGLGSKSALAYSSQFSIRSRHAGVETSALVFLNDKGEGEIRIVDTKATDKTGTRIEIPVTPKDVSKFEDHIAQIFQFWKKSDVTVKGVALDHGYDAWLWVSENIAFAPKNFTMHASRSSLYNSRYHYMDADVVAVQGGVPYTIDRNSLNAEAQTLFDALPRRHHGVVFVAPIGSLQFTPSRESLYYTNSTNAALISLFTEYKENIAGWIAEKIANSANKEEALSTYEEYSYLIPDGSDIRWNGQIVPASVPCVTFATDTAKRSNGTKTKTLPKLVAVKKADLIVYGATENQVTDKGSYSVRVNCNGYLGKGYRLVERWYGSNGAKAQEILIIQGDLPESFDWYGVEAIHIDKIKPSGGRKPKGSLSQAHLDYHNREWAHVGNGYYGQMKKIDPANDKVVYASRAEAYEMRERPDDWTVVVVNANQHGKFAAAFPLARTREQVRTAAIADSNITLDEAASTYRAKTWDHNSLLKLSESKILDPDLASVVSWMKNQPISATVAGSIQAKYRWLNIHIQVDDVPTPTLDKISKRYGFLFGNVKSNDLLDTLNALYTYKYQGGTP